MGGNNWLFLLAFLFLCSSICEGSSSEGNVIKKIYEKLIQKLERNYVNKGKSKICAECGSEVKRVEYVKTMTEKSGSNWTIFGKLLKGKKK